MRRTLIAALALAGTAACAKGENNAAAGDTSRTGVDTMVTERTVQDTQIVTTDTSVRVDTMTKRGGVVDSTAARRP
jgi:hypothetical protein